MDRFLEMQTFCAVAEAGSFIKAADTLGFSKAAVSRYISELEGRLGVRLLHRTTRRVSLTDEGRIFNARCRELLSDVEEAEAELNSHSGAARGLLRVNAPVTFGISYLAPLWGAFRAQHSDVMLDITLSDRIVDMVDEGYDLVIRIASLPSSTLISRKLASTRLVLCASSQYLSTHGTPKHPSELVNHAVIAYSYYATGDEWKFDGPQGSVNVAIKPWMHSNNGDTCLAAALADQGIVFQPSFLVSECLADGRLVELLPEYRTTELGIYAIYPTRKHIAPKVRVLIDFLVQQFSKSAIF